MSNNTNHKRIRTLEHHIDETLDLIQRYEDKLRLSDDPKEQRDCEQQIACLRSQLNEHQTELNTLSPTIPKSEPPGRRGDTGHPIEPPLGGTVGKGRSGIDLNWLNDVFRSDAAPLLLIHGKLDERASEPSLTHYLTVLFEKYTPLLPPKIHPKERFYIEKACQNLQRRDYSEPSSTPNVDLSSQKVFPVLVGEPPDDRELQDFLSKSPPGIQFPGIASSSLRGFTTPKCPADCGLYFMLKQIADDAGREQELNIDVAQMPPKYANQVSLFNRVVPQ